MPTVSDVTLRCLGFFCFFSISWCVTYILVRVFWEKEPDLNESFDRARQKNTENKS